MENHWDPQTEGYHLEKTLTVFFAENKQKLSGAVLHIGVNVCHQANQFVPHCIAHFRSVLDITQWGQHLHANTPPHT